MCSGFGVTVTMRLPATWQPLLSSDAKSLGLRVQAERGAISDIFWGGWATMAIYEYRCANCGHEFSLKLSFSEHDRAAIRCPVCGSAEVVQRISAFSVKASRKS